MIRLKNLQHGISLVFIVTMGYLALQGKWDRQLILASGLFLCGLPWVVERYLKVKLPESSQLIFVLFIFSAQYLGSFIGFYGLFPWWDLALHLFSGFLMSYWGMVLVVMLDRKLLLYKERQIGLIVMILFLAGVASAGLWEIIEFLGDRLIGTNAQLGSLRDTMEDIICGTIGGGLFAAYIGIVMAKNKRNVIDQLFSCNQAQQQNRQAMRKRKS